MRRRDFLTTVAAASVLPQISGRAAAAPAAPGTAPLKLGVASYSFRKFPFDKCLEMAKALDAKYINFKDVHIPRPIRGRPPARQDGSGRLHHHGRRHDHDDERRGGGPQGLRAAKLAGMLLIVAAPRADSLDVVGSWRSTTSRSRSTTTVGRQNFRLRRCLQGREGTRQGHGPVHDIGHSWRAGADPTRRCRAARPRYDFHGRICATSKRRTASASSARRIDLQDYSARW